MTWMSLAYILAMQIVTVIMVPFHMLLAGPGYRAYAARVAMLVWGIGMLGWGVAVWLVAGQPS